MRTIWEIRARSAALFLVWGTVICCPEPALQAIEANRKTLDSQPTATPSKSPPLRTKSADVSRSRPVGPREPSPLAVNGFYPASHVGPGPRGKGPWPVTVALHGNYDRPEWECDLWSEVADSFGWVLCPRGVRVSYVDPAEDRWTYGGLRRVKQEIEAGWQALENRYPGQVKSNGSILAGFSLGAIYAPRLAIQLSPRFKIIFLVEGGLKKEWSRQQIRALKRVGVRGVGLAMSDPERRTRAKKLVRRLKRWKMGAAFVDMRGAGHNYSKDFAITGRRALSHLLSFFDKDSPNGVVSGAPAMGAGAENP